LGDQFGSLSTMMTESPLRNILLMNLSLFIGRAFFLPLPVLGTWKEMNPRSIALSQIKIF